MSRTLLSPACCSLLKKEMKYDHCCEAMTYHAHHPSVPLKYHPAKRMYFLLMEGKRGTILTFCPFCGKELPPELSGVYYDILQELGFENPFAVRIRQIPKEYRSDAWWKAKGL